MCYKTGQIINSLHAEYLGVDEATVRKYHFKLGGVRLGKRILFFDKLIERSIYALLQQKKGQMDCVCQEVRDTQTGNLCNQDGSPELGSPVAKISRKELARRDKFNLLSD
jgi:hypothetical protein